MAKTQMQSASDRADAEFEQELKQQAADVGLNVRMANGLNQAIPYTTAGNIPEPKYEMPVADAMKSTDPAARQVIVENAIYRNRLNKPEQSKSWFEVEHYFAKTGEFKKTKVQAHNDIDAIAVANDLLKVSPNPSTVRVKAIA